MCYPKYPTPRIANPGYNNNNNNNNCLFHQKTYMQWFKKLLQGKTAKQTARFPILYE